MRLFKKRPKAKIKIGNTFLGDKISATAEGYVIYSEYDKSDRKTYYWEEWELRGFNNYDSWIEYDHYTKKITLYEPLRPQPFIDAAQLKPNQEISFTTHRGEQITATVIEVGLGIVARREGTLTHHVFEKDTVAYAECRGAQGIFSIETYNEKEFDIYRGTVLTRAAQKRLLGRVVEPRNISAKAAVYVAAFVGFFGFSMYSEAAESKNECTPRTTTSSIILQVNRPASMYSHLAQQSIPLNKTPGSSSPGVQSPSTKTQTTPSSTQNTCNSRSVYGGSGGGYGK